MRIKSNDTGVMKKSKNRRLVEFIENRDVIFYSYREQLSS